MFCCLQRLQIRFHPPRSYCWCPLNLLKHLDLGMAWWIRCLRLPGLSYICRPSRTKSHTKHVPLSLCPDSISLLLITPPTDAGSAKILFNNGKGYFFSREKYSFPFVRRGINRVDLVDLDHDRDIDLIFTGVEVLRVDGQRDKWQGQVLINNGKGEFKDETELLWPQLPPGIAGTSIADYDGDSFPDVFLIYGNGQNRLLINNDWNDDDQDGVADENDQCHFGESNWDSNTMTDFDGDGCRDSSEDFDDDNDGVLDEFDECPLGVSNSALNDADGDGCDDLIEDTDNDGDGIPNHIDNCPNGAQYWTSFSTDYDGDGCRDPDEDNNDDNDPFLDVNDECPTGVIGWTDVTFDHDLDGCHDLEEDTDDDSDGVLDTEDLCPIGLMLGLLSVMLMALSMVFQLSLI